MLYKLLNKLFGWDYIHWNNAVDSGIARVHLAPNGSAYYWRYKSTKCLDPLPPIRHAYSFVDTKISWLTCKPEKYFHE